MRKAWAIGGAVVALALLVGGLVWRSRITAERRRDLLSISEFKSDQAEHMGLEQLRAELIRANDARFHALVEAFAKADQPSEWLKDQAGRASGAVAMLQAWKDEPLEAQASELRYRQVLGATKGETAALQARAAALTARP